MHVDRWLLSRFELPIDYGDATMRTEHYQREATTASLGEVGVGEGTGFVDQNHGIESLGLIVIGRVVGGDGAGADRKK
jgi:hypothetical protein